jgi:hypothetical protein
MFQHVDGHTLLLWISQQYATPFGTSLRGQCKFNHISCTISLFFRRRALVRLYAASKGRPFRIHPFASSIRQLFLQHQPAVLWFDALLMIMTLSEMLLTD